MPAVQKKYKPIRVDKLQQDYYHLVTPSDEAFSFFCLKNYKDFTSYSKWKKERKPSGMQDDEDEPCKYQKDKLGGKKLQKAIMEYNDWLCKFHEIQKNKRSSKLAKDIKIHCRQIKNKNKEKRMAEYQEDSLNVGMLSVPK